MKNSGYNNSIRQAGLLENYKKLVERKVVTDTTLPCFHKKDVMLFSSQMLKLVKDL